MLFRSPGASQDDVILIPSDDESDYGCDEPCEPNEPDGGGLCDGQSDVSVPPAEVSAANNEESGGITGRDYSFSVSSGIGGDGGAAETSTVHGPELDDEALDIKHFPAPAFPPASPERRFASAEPLQLAQDPHNLAGNIHAPRSGSGWPLPEAATCEGAKGLPSASPARGAGAPSSGCLSGLCSPGLEDHSGRKGMPCRRPVGEC